MIRRPPGSTLTDTLLPYTTLFRAAAAVEKAGDRRAVILILRGEIARADVFEQLQRAVRGGGAEIGVARVGEQRHALLHDEGVEIARVARRSEEHTSELQSLMRISYAVLCLKTTNIHVYQA